MGRDKEEMGIVTQGEKLGFRTLLSDFGSPKRNG